MDIAPTVTKPKAGDYETFLRMMTVQIRNQDPLSPMNADEFAVQLATFSAVEQQTKTNDLLTQQISMSAQNAMAQMAGWVGKQARIAAPVHYDGATPVTLSPNPALTADRAVLVVTDASGIEVSRTEVPVSSADYEWMGLDNERNPLPEGVYSLEMESYYGDQLMGSTSVEYYGTIEEIRSSPSGLTALFPGGVEVSTALVTALRAPSAW
jgi:flagellar basal-body rod modification protein FlgD